MAIAYRGNAGDARRRHEGFAAQAELFGRASPRYGPLDPRTTLSPRVTPQMIGLGLVEQIHPADILAHADPDDRDGDGISGKASIVRDGKSGELTLGRFGWKALDAVDPPADGRRLRRRHRHLDAGSAEITGATAPRPRPIACAMPIGVQERLGDSRGAGSGHGPRHLLFAEPRRAGAPRHRQAGGACAASRCSTRPAAPPATRRNS